MRVIFSFFVTVIRERNDTLEFDRDEYVSKAGSSSERAWREKLIEQQYFLQVNK